MKSYKTKAYSAIMWKEVEIEIDEDLQKRIKEKK